ncbi:histone deacetylase (plasmid) [Nocardia farcinica]|uniref:histone deacetylase n=1 Tax=Nocardia farcinica TaxID=37329 RepID=UPI001894BF42|nr:histone deacetylase [Nocardia farcinica]MBF6284474.1 histone deacetylase [Nocardia farcinica]
MPDYVWYAAYGSNLHARRLAYYIEGGTPPGTDHTYPGFRDQTPPLKTRPLTLPGTIYFAWNSPVWTGGVAFYATEPRETWPKDAAVRGYLLTIGQFSDLLTQEMYRQPSDDLDLTEVLSTGRSQLGPGRYETLVLADELDGWPVLTFTSPWDIDTVELRRPSARYLRMISTGLHESHKWSASRIRDYLSNRPGIQGEWHHPELTDLVEQALTSSEVE